MLKNFTHILITTLLLTSITCGILALFVTYVNSIGANADYMRVCLLGGSTTAILNILLSIVFLKEKIKR